MQNLTTVKPSIVNDIEFYVSPDGLDSGVSLNGLSRLAGVSIATLSVLVNNLEDTQSGKTTPKALESLRGKVYSSSLASLRTNLGKPTRIISSKAAARIIRYYAYESKAANDTAKFAYDKFAEMGVHTWILSSTGFQTSEELSVDLKASLSGLEAVKKLARRYLNVSDNTENKPGLSAILEDYSMNNYANAIAPSKVTLKDYLSGKRITLSKQQMGAVSLIVASTYKLHNGRNPESVSFSYVAPSGKTAVMKCYCYSVDDYTMIDQALTLAGII